MIAAKKATYPVTLMCDALGVSRSGYYASCKRTRPNGREVRDAELLDKIREIHAASRGTYGSPRVHAELLRQGVDVCKDRVARLMKADGLRGRVRRRFKVTTDSKHREPVAPNTLNQEFVAEFSDSVWCADITYISTTSGWVYLAAIIDVATRMIVGWSMASHMRTELGDLDELSEEAGKAPLADLRTRPIRLLPDEKQPGYLERRLEFVPGRPSPTVSKTLCFMGQLGNAVHEPRRFVVAEDDPDSCHVAPMAIRTLAATTDLELPAIRDPVARTSGRGASDAKEVIAQLRPVFRLLAQRAEEEVLNLPTGWEVERRYIFTSWGRSALDPHSAGSRTIGCSRRRPS